MKRDMDLVRKILLEIESHDHGHAPQNLEVDGFDAETIGFHFHLMGEAGLLRIADVTCMGDQSPNAIPLNITWTGYEFLEAARSQTTWSKAKKKLMDAGLGLPFDLFRVVLIELAKEKLGLSDTAP